MIKDISNKNKKGLPFILASCVIWTLITVAMLLPIEEYKIINLIILCCASLVMPLGYLFTKMLKLEFSVKNNPLSKVILIFTLNQMIYLLIVIWAFNGAPEKMVMIYAIIYGAHLFPYHWVYQSPIYKYMAFIIPVISFVLGYILSGTTMFLLPGFVLLCEIIFAVKLYAEFKERNE